MSKPTGEKSHIQPTRPGSRKLRSLAAMPVAAVALLAGTGCDQTIKAPSPRNFFLTDLKTSGHRTTANLLGCIPTANTIGKGGPIDNIGETTFGSSYKIEQASPKGQRLELTGTTSIGE